MDNLWAMRIQCQDCGAIGDNTKSPKLFCPFCGTFGEKGDNFKHIAVREVGSGKWWQFWKKKTKEFKAID